MTQLMLVPYRPTEEEPYMNARQLAYFREMLTTRKMELTTKATQLKTLIKRFRVHSADIIDQSNSYMDMERNLTAYDRCIRTVQQIDDALKRIEEGRFGYCELTGEAHRPEAVGSHALYQHVHGSP